MMQNRMARALAGLAGTLVVATMALAGCSNAGDDDSAVSRSETASDSASGGSEALARPASPSAANKASRPPVDLATATLPGAPRDIVYTARLDVRVRNVERALRAATAVVDGAGGSVFKQQSDLDHSPVVDVTFKVPPDAFDGVVADLSQLGRVRNRRVNASDVTGRVVDLDARVAAARTSVERLRTLLADSGNVGDLLAVENALAAREGELESLEGQLAALRGRVDQATITVEFTARPVVAPEPEKETHLPGFPSGLRAGARAFRDTAVVVGGAFGFALPFLLIAVVLGAPFLFVRRARRHAGA